MKRFLVILLFCSAQSWGTIALVANTSNVCGSGSCTATTGSLNTTGATLLVAFVGTGADCGDPTGFTVSDSNGNTWHHLALENDCAVSGVDTTIWYAFDHGGSPLVVGSGNTVTIVGSNVTSTVAAFSGTQTTSDPFDQQSGGKSVSGSCQNGSITPGSNGELIYTGAESVSGSSGGNVFTVDSSLSLTGSNSTYNFNGFGNSADAWLGQFTASAIAPLWSNIAGSGVCSIASFKAGAGGGGTTPPPNNLLMIQGGKLTIQGGRVTVQ